MLAPGTYAGIKERKDKHIQVKNLGSKDGRRVASIHLTLCGDSDQQMLRPLIVFKGKGRVFDRECEHYHPEVKVMFQPNAWLDSAILKRWYEEELIPHKCNVVGQHKALLLLDNLAAQRDAECLQLLKDNGIECFFGPSKLTHRWQPVDMGFGAHFKALVSQGLENYLDANPDFADNLEHGRLDARAERILLSQLVGEAFNEISQAKFRKGQHRYFEKTGCLITLDGSDDHLIQIEGLDGYKPYPAFGASVRFGGSRRQQHGDDPDGQRPGHFAHHPA
eukprot:Skav212453  [mRNA]  locus=scaffold385:65001:65834:+ [translate_table: standard]